MTRLIQVEDFAAFQKNVQAHFEDHYKTCEEYRNKFERLDVDAELVQKLISSGHFYLFCIYDNNEFVGYVGTTVAPNYVLGKVHAITDLIYILPPHRRNGYMEFAVQSIEKELVKLGIDDHSLSLPNKEYSLPVAQSLGYHETSAVYSKYLGE